MRAIRKIGLIALLLIVAGAWANAGNLRIADNVKVVKADNNGFTLSLSLSWENSWYDDYNFDAVWVFAKYKIPGMESWGIVYFKNTGHQLGTNGGCVMSDPAEPESVGMFVYSRTSQDGKVEMNVQLECMMPLGVTKTDFDNNQVYFAVQGIEMAYIPAGAYYLGDGVAAGSLVKDGKPILIDSEKAITVKDLNGEEYILAAEYPKGYDGFFCMKTEVSQKQYVDFLNLLTYTEQASRVAGNLLRMNEGEYIFGTSRVRNGIAIAKNPKTASIPCIFINDLNGNGVGEESEDGQSVACGYLSPSDAYVFCGWAGLRPMTELEYEKACRPLFPEPLVPRGYVWNTANGAVTVVESNLVQKNTKAESVEGSTANINAGNGIAYPLRGGAFARSNSTAQNAGATYWGVMELGGNLREICISALEGEYMTSDCGDGNAQSNWDGSSFIAKGGAYDAALTKAQVSDRSEMDFIAENEHHPAVGFRGVRSIKAGDPGRIAAPNGNAIDTLCSGTACKIRSVAVPDVSNADSYVWLVKKEGQEQWETISGQNGTSLTYDPGVLDAGFSHFVFRRVAVSRMGRLVTQPVEIVFFNNNLLLNCVKDTVDKCGETRVLEATHVKSGTIAWKKGSTILLQQAKINGLGYLPERAVGSAGTTVTLTCESTIGACKQSATVALYIAPEASNPAVECWQCGDVVKDAAGNAYGTVTMADDRCWMSSNMRLEKEGSLLQPGVDPGVYGRLYTWNTAMNGTDFEGAQGICPDGWSIPTYTEWLTLVTALGGMETAGQVMQNNHDFKLPLAGNYNDGAGNYVNLDVMGNYWSSTLKTGDTENALGITIKGTSTAVLPLESALKNGISVRCIKNKK